MAIKLNVSPQLGGNAAIGPAAEIPRAFGQMGNAVANPVNLPQENAGAIASQMQQAGATTAAMYNQIGNTITGLTDQYIGLLKAEDSDIANRTYEELKVKRAEISAKNEQEVLAGRMTYGALPEANRKAYDALHNETLANLKLNLPKTADDLNFKLRTDTDGLFVNDMQYTQRKIAEQSINSYKVEIENTADILKNGLRGLEEYNRKKQAILSDPRINVLGPDVVTKKLTDLSSKAAGSYLTDLIKTAPDEYMRLERDGSLDAFFTTFTDEERKMFNQDALMSKTSKLNAADAAFKKSSEEVVTNYELQMYGKDAKLPTESQIRGDTRLVPEHKLKLIKQIEEFNGKSIAERRKSIERAELIKIGGGTHILLTPDQSSEELRTLYNKEYTNGLTSSENAYSALIKFQKIDSRVKTLQPFIDKVMARPTPGMSDEDKSKWAMTVKKTTDLYPELLADSNYKDTARTALIMVNFGKTYGETTLQDITDNELKVMSKFDASLWDKNSAYKNPGSSKGLPEAKDSPVILEQFKKQIEYESQFGGTQEEIVKRARQALNLSTIEMPDGKEVAMTNAPKIPSEYQKNFKTHLGEVFAANKIPADSGRIRYLDTDENGNKVYAVTNGYYPVKDKNGNQVTFQPDLNRYATERQTNAAIPTQVKNVIKKNPDKIAHIGYIESSFDQLKQNRGVMLGIWIAESSAGANPGRSSAGALGDFQLMEGTANDLGVKDRTDFRQASYGAAKYMDQNIKQFGNLNDAIMAYNWGPGNVQKWIDGTLQREGKDGRVIKQTIPRDPKWVPSETRNYLTKVLSVKEQANSFTTLTPPPSSLDVSNRTSVGKISYNKGQ